MPLKSTFPDIEIPTTTLTEFVLAKASELGDAPALVDGASDRTITYAQLKPLIQKVAGGLRKAGFEKGDTFAIMAPNLPEYALAFHSVAWLGGCVTTINPTYTENEVLHQLIDSKAKFLLTIGMFLETASKASKGEGSKVSKIFTFDGAEGSIAFKTLIGAESVDEQVKVDPETHVVALPYSSGTTGKSKGVMLTHRNLIANIAQCVASGVKFAVGDAFVCVLPFFHIYGMQVLLNMGLYSGCKLVTVPRFDLVQFLELNQKHKCTWAFIVPPIVLALAKHPIVAKYDLTTLRVVFSGAAPLGAEVAAQASERLNVAVIQGYGMTELSPVTHLSEEGKAKPGSCGRTVANTECRIVDLDGKDVANGERGELWVRGPQVMKGYLANEEATKHTIDSDGWLHTGDIAIADDEGYFFIVDRLKELIKVKGFQVPPAELEAELLKMDDITDVAVIGVPDDDAGELPKAFVVKKADSTLSEDDVKEFIKQRLATYKQLRYVEFVDTIPKSASGKILRRLLRDSEKAKRDAEKK